MSADNKAGSNGEDFVLKEVFLPTPADQFEEFEERWFADGYSRKLAPVLAAIEEQLAPVLAAIECATHGRR